MTAIALRAGLAGLAFTLALAAAPGAGAQKLSPAPLPGLWEGEWAMSLNGQDIGVLVRKMQEEMLKSLPPAQRQQMQAMMEAQMGGMPGMGGVRKDCLTPEDAARAADPATALSDMQRDAPQCRFDPATVNGNALSFKGRCEDPNGFTGDVDGNFTMNSDKAWVGRYGGKGRMAKANEIPGLVLGKDGMVDFRMEGKSRWVAADCGDVKPTPR